MGKIYTALFLLGATSLAVAEDLPPMVPGVESLDASSNSFDFDWKHARINLEQDELQYGLRLNKGEFSIENSDRGWKTTFDLPDQQIKLEWGF